MERESNPMQPQCRSGCGFYGNPAQDGLCSVCYKDSLRKKQQPPVSSTSVSVPSPQSTPTFSPAITITSTAKPTVQSLHQLNDTIKEAALSKQKDEVKDVNDDGAGPSKSPAVQPATTTTPPPPSSTDHLRNNNNNSVSSVALRAQSVDGVGNMNNALGAAKRKIKNLTATATVRNRSNIVLKKRKLSEDAVKDNLVSAAGPSTSTNTEQDDNDKDDDNKDGKKKKNRCASCRKKVGLTGFECRCGGLYCAVHRYSDKHNCTFDYREHGAQEIRRNNPVVVGEKIQKI